MDPTVGGAWSRQNANEPVPNRARAGLFALLIVVALTSIVAVILAGQALA